MSGQLDPATYDAWFDQPCGSHAFDVEGDTLLGALSPLEGRRLLDVGCGTGRFTAAYEAAGVHVVGIDCHDARGLADDQHRAGGWPRRQLVDGPRRSTMDELTDWTLDAERIITF